ncbi:MAG: ATP-binding protein [Ignavibacteriaceae bacterium]
MRKTNEKGVRTKLISITGSRKIGKTAFAQHYIHLMSGAYITVTKSASHIQLDEIVTYLNTFSTLEDTVPEFKDWHDLLIFFFELGKEQQTNLVIDECHNLKKVQPDILDFIKTLYIINQNESELNIIFVSHDNDFLQHVFRSPDSPLFQTQHFTLNLSPFNFYEVFSLYKFHKTKLDLNEIVRIYTVFGGFPKYVHLFDLYKLWDCTLEELLEQLVFRHYAPLGYELKDLLINNFSRDSETYLRILQAIGGGKSTLTEISEEVGFPVTTISKYIHELEKKRGIIKKKQPITTKIRSSSKFGKYYLSNYFENFWFKFIQPYIIPYELEHYVELFADVLPLLKDYSDRRKVLIIRELLRMIKHYAPLKDKYAGCEFRVGAHWDRSEEIEIVAVDEVRKTVIFGFTFTSAPCNFEMVNSAVKIIKYFKSTYKDFRKDIIIFYNGEITKDAEDLSTQKNFTVVDYNQFISELATNREIMEKVIEIPEFLDIEAGNLF